MSMLRMDKGDILTEPVFIYPLCAQLMSVKTYHRPLHETRKHNAICLFMYASYFIPKTGMTVPYSRCGAKLVLNWVHIPELQVLYLVETAFLHIGLNCIFTVEVQLCQCVCLTEQLSVKSDSDLPSWNTVSVPLFLKGYAPLNRKGHHRTTLPCHPQN